MRSRQRSLRDRVQIACRDRHSRARLACAQQGCSLFGTRQRCRAVTQRPHRSTPALLTRPLSGLALLLRDSCWANQSRHALTCTGVACHLRSSGASAGSSAPEGASASSAGAVCTAGQHTCCHRACCQVQASVPHPWRAQCVPAHGHHRPARHHLTTPHPASRPTRTWPCLHRPISNSRPGPWPYKPTARAPPHRQRHRPLPTIDGRRHHQHAALDEVLLVGRGSRHCRFHLGGSGVCMVRCRRRLRAVRAVARRQVRPQVARTHTCAACAAGAAPAASASAGHAPCRAPAHLRVRARAHDHARVAAQAAEAHAPPVGELHGARGQSLLAPQPRHLLVTRLRACVHAACGASGRLSAGLLSPCLLAHTPAHTAHVRTRAQPLSPCTRTFRSLCRRNAQTPTAAALMPMFVPISCSCACACGVASTPPTWCACSV